MIRKFIGNKIESILNQIAIFFHQKNVSPNVLTLTGLCVSVFAGYFYYRGWFIVGALTMLLGGFFDMLDGAVARIGGRASKIGGFTDSVIDRYSDFLVFGGLLGCFAEQGNSTGTLLLLAIICGSFMVSYVRARAELLIPKCAVGLMERPERIIILAAGSLFNFLTISLWILAIGTHVTALHRIYFTLKTSKTVSE